MNHDKMASALFNAELHTGKGTMLSDAGVLEVCEALLYAADTGTITLELHEQLLGAERLKRKQLEAELDGMRGRAKRAEEQRDYANAENERRLEEILEQRRAIADLEALFQTTKGVGVHHSWVEAGTRTQRAEAEVKSLKRELAARRTELDETRAVFDRLRETVSKREQEHLEACAEADEHRARVAELENERAAWLEWMKQRDRVLLELSSNVAEVARLKRNIDLMREGDEQFFEKVREGCAAVVEARVLVMYARGAKCDPQRAELVVAAEAVRALPFSAFREDLP